MSGQCRQQFFMAAVSLPVPAPLTAGRAPGTLADDVEEDAAVGLAAGFFPIGQFPGSSPLLYGRKVWLTSRKSCIDLGSLRTQAGTRYGSSHPGRDYGVSGAGY